MNINLFIEALFERAKKRNFGDFEIYYLSSEKSSLKVFNQEVESYSDSQSQGISFRVLSEGKMGYSYTESITMNDIDFLINEALENASVIENDDLEEIFDGSGTYAEIKAYNPDLKNISVDKKIAFLIEVEKKALEMDTRIKKLNYCLFGDGSALKIIKNSKGMDLHDSGNSAHTYISVIAEEKGVIKSGSGYYISNDFSEFRAEQIAKDAVEDAISKLNPVSTESKECPVIIKNETFADMLGAFTGIFSGDNVQKGISKLKGKLGEPIASSVVTIMDNPHLKGGIASSSFDAEGVPTFCKEVIKDGVLKTYLYNLKTAKKSGVKSTGNASKGGYKGTLGTAPSNFYIENGALAYEKVLSRVNDGILVTSLSGLHSGLNSISGDFSLAAEGFIIDRGKISKPLNQITIAGNFFQLLKNIEIVADDLKFGLSPIGSPSVLIKKLNISAD